MQKRKHGRMVTGVMFSSGKNIHHPGFSVNVVAPISHKREKPENQGSKRQSQKQWQNMAQSGGEEKTEASKQGLSDRDKRFIKEYHDRLTMLLNNLQKRVLLTMPDNQRNILQEIVASFSDQIKSVLQSKDLNEAKEKFHILLPRIRQVLNTLYKFYGHGSGFKQISEGNCKYVARIVYSPKSCVQAKICFDSKGVPYVVENTLYGSECTQQAGKLGKPRIQPPRNIQMT